uniref:Uncharacterized protein n=1 Tax=viral metagenome TaxID=1070528 RepID=A0A6H1Z9T8_9ZZZZ
MSIEHSIDGTKYEATYRCDAPGCDKSVVMVNPGQKQLGLDQLGWHDSGMGKHYCPKCWGHLKPQSPPAPPQAHRPIWPCSLRRMLSEERGRAILQLQNGDLLWDSHLERIRVVDWVEEIPATHCRLGYHILHLVPIFSDTRPSVRDHLRVMRGREAIFNDKYLTTLHLLKPTVDDWVRIGSDPNDQGQVLQVSEEPPIDSGYLRLELAHPWLSGTSGAIWEAESVRVCQEPQVDKTLPSLRTYTKEEVAKAIKDWKEEVAKAIKDWEPYRPTYASEEELKRMAGEVRRTVNMRLKETMLSKADVPSSRPEFGRDLLLLRREKGILEGWSAIIEDVFLDEPPGQDVLNVRLLFRSGVGPAVQADVVEQVSKWLARWPSGANSLVLPYTSRQAFDDAVEFQLNAEQREGTEMINQSQSQGLTGFITPALQDLPSPRSAPRSFAIDMDLVDRGWVRAGGVTRILKALYRKGWKWRDSAPEAVGMAEKALRAGDSKIVLCLTHPDAAGNLFTFNTRDDAEMYYPGVVIFSATKILSQAPVAEQKAPVPTTPPVTAQQIRAALLADFPQIDGLVIGEDGLVIFRDPPKCQVTLHVLPAPLVDAAGLSIGLKHWLRANAPCHVRYNTVMYTLDEWRNVMGRERRELAGLPKAFEQALVAHMARAAQHDAEAGFLGQLDEPRRGASPCPRDGCGDVLEGEKGSERCVSCGWPGLASSEPQAPPIAPFTMKDYRNYGPSVSNVGRDLASELRYVGVGGGLTLKEQARRKPHWGKMFLKPSFCWKCGSDLGCMCPREPRGKPER